METLEPQHPEGSNSETSAIVGSSVWNSEYDKDILVEQEPNVGLKKMARRGCDPEEGTAWTEVGDRTEPECGIVPQLSGTGGHNFTVQQLLGSKTQTLVNKLSLRVRLKSES